MRRITLDRVAKATALISPSLSAAIDWAQPTNHSSWGGPMNGQAGRRRMIACLVGQFEPTVVFETGTFRGGSSSFLADVSGATVHTVEHEERFFKFARWRHRGRSDVAVYLGDSRRFLGEMARRFPTEEPLVYLDAHWDADLPLASELEIIARAWERCVVVIDDFAVPGDDGYAFDDYGPGARLDEGILPPSVADWRRLYPTLASKDETGAIRGCLVLASPSVAVTELKRCGLAESRRE